MAATQDLLAPETIRESLPEKDQAWFLSEYRAAAERATHDPAQWGELRQLLHSWRLRAVARQSSGYYESQEQALRGEGPSVSLDEIIRRHDATG